MKKRTKIIIIVVVCIFVLPLIIALFLPNHYMVKSSVTFNKPKTEVMDYMRFLKNQEEYSYWANMDSTSKFEYKGNDGQVGSIQSWKGEEAGSGEQEITSINEDQIGIDLRFKEPFEDNAKSITTFKSISENETEVTSEFHGNSKYPMNLMTFYFKKMIHDGETKTLEGAKSKLENKN